MFPKNYKTLVPVVVFVFFQLWPQPLGGQWPPKEPQTEMKMAQAGWNRFQNVPQGQWGGYGGTGYPPQATVQNLENRIQNLEKQVSQIFQLLGSHWQAIDQIQKSGGAKPRMLKLPPLQRIGSPPRPLSTTLGDKERGTQMYSAQVSRQEFDQLWGHVMHLNNWLNQLQAQLSGYYY